MDSPVTQKAALLQALIREPGYGLELIERVSERTKGRVKLHQGNIYSALREMEGERLVKSYDGPSMPERGGRPRRYYKITAAGARAAREQLEVVAGVFALEMP